MPVVDIDLELQRPHRVCLLMVIIIGELLGVMLTGGWFPDFSTLQTTFDSFSNYHQVSKPN